MIYLSRRIGFSAAHRYFQKELSDAENKKIFGSCYNENGHGHNYVLEMTVSGPVDSQTGMVMNLVEIDKILKEVIDPMDHHHLNFDLEAFKNTVPTTENVAKYSFEEIKRRLPSLVKLERVRLFENENLWADFYG
jgi:6-pyruvoyltetrahydropterin/6-carboxytetrahydropterin synthase